MDRFQLQGCKFGLMAGLYFISLQGVAGERPIEPATKVLRLTQFEALRSADDSRVGAPSAITLPDSWHEHQQTPFRHTWYRTSLDFKKDLPVVRHSFAVYIPRVSMNASVSINGREIGNGGRLSEPISRNHGRPLLFFVPAWAAEQSGPIYLTIHVADNSWAFGYLGPVYVGDAAVLGSMYRARDFWQVQLTTALALLMLIFSLTSFVLFTRRRKETHYFWFGAAMLLFAVYTFNVFVTDIPVERKIWEIYNQEVVFAFAVAVIVFIQRSTRQGWRRVETLLGMLLLIQPGVLLIVDASQLFAAASVFNLIVIVYGLALAVMVVIGYFKTASFESGVTALSGVVLLAVAFHTWLVQVGVFDPENLHIIHYGAPCFFLLISLSLVSRFIQSLEHTEMLASQLDTRVRTKEKELAASYAELNVVNQQRTLAEERERIMREVHDGFGGHLINALTMLEAGEFNRRELVDYLKYSLLDLRVMIDSLDPHIHEISVALCVLRSRVEPMLRNRNISLVWDVRDLPLEMRLNPNETLSLLRVLQELFTNIVKHSDADQIRVRAKTHRTDTQSLLQIQFRENGRGFDPDSRPGRGIGNVRKRIQDLQGEITFKQQADGFETSIVIPGFSLN